MQNKEEKANYTELYSTLLEKLNMCIEGYLNSLKRLGGTEQKERVKHIPNPDRKLACTILITLAELLKASTDKEDKEKYRILLGGIYREYLKIEGSYGSISQSMGYTSTNSTLAIGLLSTLGEKKPSNTRAINTLGCYKHFLTAKQAEFSLEVSVDIPEFNIQKELIRLTKQITAFEVESIEESKPSTLPTNNSKKKASVVKVTSTSSSANTTNVTQSSSVNAKVEPSTTPVVSAVVEDTSSSSTNSDQETKGSSVEENLQLSTVIPESEVDNSTVKELNNKDATEEPKDEDSNSNNTDTQNKSPSVTDVGMFQPVETSKSKKKKKKNKHKEELEAHDEKSDTEELTTTPAPTPK